MEKAAIPVRVSLRIRPLVPREQRDGSQVCLDVTANNPQVIIRGTEKAFTFDHVFDRDSTQNEVYNSAVQKVVQQLFKGYNVTVLAYGQTGSGKTHSMGTSYSKSIPHDEKGVIPRAVQDIFTKLEGDEGNDYVVKVSFVELYKEVLYDLLNPNSRCESTLEIREDVRGGIKLDGLTEIPVNSLAETMLCLEQGSTNRATGATAMNAQSSRSHAIFSLHVEMNPKGDKDNLMTSKFHLVDLAGSERAKKTGAVGERFKEGVNINKGLLALGNVISSLCEGKKDGGHIPYRDSKLTRLLQDSLGGNSFTVMIACVSPADSNLDETLSTLRYADRARKIKNKPIVNKDPQAAELARLRAQVQQLLASNPSGFTGGSQIESSHAKELIEENNSLKEENEKLMRALQVAVEENTSMAEKAIMAEASKEKFKQRLEELSAQTGTAVETLNKTLDVASNPQFNDQMTLVKDLQVKISDLQAEQKKNDRMLVEHELSRHNVSTATSFIAQTDDSTEDANQDSETLKNEAAVLSTLPVDFGATYTLRQAKLTEELQELNKALLLKEELKNKMSANENMFSVKFDYESNLKNLEDQISILQKEKDELSQKLKNSSLAVTSKISEQRRKRLQELEGHVNNLKQKMKEQAKLIKMKGQSEAKVNKLSSEIMNIKSARIKLIRQIKEDSEKFRVWKAKKEREVAKLKQEDRKKQNQIVKMEQMQQKQQNVFKRKMEENVACIKRLKDAMALQKSCSERRNISKGTEGMSNRIRLWMKDEIEVSVIKKQARQSLHELIEDRKQISDQINSISNQLESNTFSDAMEGQLEKKKLDLQKELEVRSAQINDLQAKIVDEDSDVVNKKRFESMQNMMEAKCTLKYLFEELTSSTVDLSSRDSEIKELQAQLKERSVIIERHIEEVKYVKDAHVSELEKLSREHEEKILYIISGMNSKDEENELKSSDEVVLQKMKLQESEIKRLMKVHEDLDKKAQECDDLKRQLKEMEENAKRLPKITVSTPPKKSKKKEQKKYEVMSFSSSSDEEENVDYDTDDDPDWKQTPLCRKINQLRNNTKFKVLEPTVPKQRGKKRSVDEIKCGCKKTGCKTKQCLCKSSGNDCGLNCTCNLSLCQNKGMGFASKPDDSSDSPPDAWLKNPKLDSTFTQVKDVSSEDTTVNLLQENKPKRIRLLGKSSSATSLNEENIDPNSTYSTKLQDRLRALESTPDMFAE